MISPHLAVLANDGIVLEQHYRSETVYHVSCVFTSVLKKFIQLPQKDVKIVSKVLQGINSKHVSFVMSMEKTNNFATCKTRMRLMFSQ